MYSKQSYEKNEANWFHVYMFIARILLQYCVTVSIYPVIKQLNKQPTRHQISYKGTRYLIRIAIDSYALLDRTRKIKMNDKRRVILQQIIQ